jgi:hypothetical protein
MKDRTMAHPPMVTIGSLSISVDSQGSPHWTRLQDGAATIIMRPEEARLTLFAMQRIVAFLDVQEEQDRKNGFIWS